MTVIANPRAIPPAATTTTTPCLRGLLVFSSDLMAARPPAGRLVCLLPAVHSHHDVCQVDTSTGHWSTTQRMKGHGGQRPWPLTGDAISRGEHLAGIHPESALLP